MKKKKKWIKWVVILVIVAAVVGWFMMVSRKTQDVAYTNVQDAGQHRDLLQF